MKTLAQLADELIEKGKKTLPKKRQRGRIHYHCKVCGFDWISRVLNPKECPACKSRNWKTGKTAGGKEGKTVVAGDKYE